MPTVAAVDGHGQVAVGRHVPQVTAHTIRIQAVNDGVTGIPHRPEQADLIAGGDLLYAGGKELDARGIRVRWAGDG